MSSLDKQCSPWLGFSFGTNSSTHLWIFLLFWSSGPSSSRMLVLVHATCSLFGFPHCCDCPSSWPVLSSHCIFSHTCYSRKAVSCVFIFSHLVSCTEVNLLCAVCSNDPCSSSRHHVTAVIRLATVTRRSMWASSLCSFTWVSFPLAQTCFMPWWATP